MPGLDGVLRVAVRGVASGIGLASEGVSAYKEKKKEKKNRDLSPNPPPGGDRSTDGPGQQQRDDNEPQHNGYDEHDTVEAQWELDDAQEDLATGGAGSENEVAPEGDSRDIAQITQAFLQSHPAPPPAYSANSRSLPLPVILPQRRPKDRSRGFVRAYAPVLANADIDQATWLAFLDTFEKASEANPWLQAINLASLGTMFMPHPLSMVVSLALQVGVKAAMELQGRARTNKFLDQINNSFFRPRGLFCLVMTWRPESDSPYESVNLSSAISSTISPSSGMGSSLHNKFKTSSGKTYGALEFSESAPLVFPALDALADQEGEEGEKKKNKMKKGKVWVSEYYDRRAQAKYAGKNPDNLLAKQGPKPTFKSRYADPNHAANSGNLISLLTGGHINPPSLGGGGFGGRGGFGGDGLGGFLGRGGRGRGGGFGGRGGRGGGRMGQGGGYDDEQHFDERYNNNGRGGFGGNTSRLGSDTGEGRGGGFGGGLGGSRGGLGGAGSIISSFSPPGMIKKLLKKDVLYLMVVNMPSDEEMAEAMHLLEQAGMGS